MTTTRLLQGKNFTRRTVDHNIALREGFYKKKNNPNMFDSKFGDWRVETGEFPGNIFVI